MTSPTGNKFKEANEAINNAQFALLEAANKMRKALLIKYNVMPIGIERDMTDALVSYDLLREKWGDFFRAVRRSEKLDD